MAKANYFVVVTAVVVAAALLTIIVAAGPAGATFPGRNGKIAFLSDRADGITTQIWKMDSGGRNQTQLTDGSAHVWYLDWSADGTKIAFERKHAIITMKATGTGVTRLPKAGTRNGAPAWSPDGKKIAFMSHERYQPHEIWIMNADGSGQVKLTDNTVEDLRPDWSPDGTKIAFERSNDIWAMAPDGSNQVNLTNSPDVTEQDPSWSPDGTKIAFDGIGSGFSGYDIYTMNADGSGRIRRTGGIENDVHPVWSPDGTKIAYASTDLGGDREIWRMESTVDSTGPGFRQLTFNEGSDDRPSWRPRP